MVRLRLPLFPCFSLLVCVLAAQFWPGQAKNFIDTTIPPDYSDYYKFAFNDTTFAFSCKAGTQILEGFEEDPRDWRYDDAVVKARSDIHCLSMLAYYATSDWRNVYQDKEYKLQDTGYLSVVDQAYGATVGTRIDTDNPPKIKTRHFLIKNPHNEEREATLPEVKDDASVETWLEIDFTTSLRLTKRIGVTTADRSLFWFNDGDTVSIEANNKHITWPARKIKVPPLSKTYVTETLEGEKHVSDFRYAFWLDETKDPLKFVKKRLDKGDTYLLMYRGSDKPSLEYKDGKFLLAGVPGRQVRLTLKINTRVKNKVLHEKNPVKESTCVDLKVIDL